MEQVVCFGYHIIEPIYIDDEYSVTIPYSTSDIALNNGWSTTKNPRFSNNGFLVWLCPECTKRWNEERTAIVRTLIEHKKKLHDEYMMKATTVEHRIWIVDVALKNLRIEFESYEPTTEEKKEFYN